MRVCGYVVRLCVLGYDANVFIFWIGSKLVLNLLYSQDNLKLQIFLLPLPNCQDYRHMLPCLVLCGALTQSFLYTSSALYDLSYIASWLMPLVLWTIGSRLCVFLKIRSFYITSTGLEPHDPPASSLECYNYKSMPRYVDKSFSCLCPIQVQKF